MNKSYSTKALPPGTVLREWRLEQVLGVGGFGIVYRGRGIYFDELVAIKEYFPSSISERKDGDTVVPTDSAAEEVHALGLKKFVEEAKLLWNLSKPTRHPNIVSVRSLFEIHGTAYMVMDFEDGLPLSQMLKDGRRFTEATLMPLLRPIAEGLDRAHRVGVLHRDIKPANILVNEDGRPVLIDFGSARFDTGDATSTKVTFHTPPYAAIEQYVKTYAQGPWTDIYALGVALYECVTGTKPAEVLERLHGSDSTALADGDWPGYSRAFLRAIDAAMIIRPGDRPQSMTQWLAMFDAPDDGAPLVSSPDHDDEATRFAAFTELPPEIVPVVAPQPVAVAEPAREAEPEPVAAPTMAEPLADVAPATGADIRAVAAEPADAKRRNWRVLGGVGLGGLALLGAGLVALAPREAGKASMVEGKAAASPPPPVAAAVAVVDVSQVMALPAALDALAADAGKAGRTAQEVGRIAAASTQIKGMASELSGLAGQPGKQSEVQPRMAAMAALASATGARLAQSIKQAADGQAARLAQVLPWADPRRAAAGGQSGDHRAATAALRAAYASIASAQAAASAAAEPQAALEAARAALAAAPQFTAAYAKAYGFVLPVRRDELRALVASARPTAAQVIEMGRTNKPGLFASRSKRDGYRARQGNAAQAQAELGRLDGLVGAIERASSVAAADGLVAQARAARGRLGALLASSNANNVN